MISRDGHVAAEDTSSALNGKLTQQLLVEEPILWGLDDPYLYTLRTIVSAGGEVVDRVDTPVGIRTLTFDRQTGFHLNHVPTKLKGVCEHHAGGPTGGAFPEKILRERIQLLKEMGCNAIRTAHNPRTQGFYALCDELGMMVMDEVFDGWHRKAGADYGVIDLAGLPKDHFWFYQSQWTGEPMVHLLPHWTHRFLEPGTSVPVVAYSNCEEVELFLKGASLGRMPEHPEWLEFVWHVPYAAGELKAIGYRRGHPR